ncbi:MAG TPA: S1-like domain-containing RNA-binding protein [Geobacteraceae bacterium]|nr:S1-like domain-containing RNA-binding protein [Geobacteraceae bacterium]
MEHSEQPELCRLHTLTVSHIDTKGIWLEAGERLAHLPRREAPHAAAGEPLQVFLYQDVAGELQATRRPPLAQSGEFALLTVRSVGPHGAFLDWGLAKDLLAPLSLQPERMQLGGRYLVKVELDQQGRPFANARIADCLDHDRPDLHEGDAVDLLIWQFTDLGAKVIVNHRFSALLYRDELPAGAFTGMQLSGYVKRLREDGKLDVTLRKVGAEGVADARDVILKALTAQGGSLPLHDRSTPEEIQRLLGMSKKTFKKAVGGLYKDGLVSLTDTGVGLTGKGSGRILS